PFAGALVNSPGRQEPLRRTDSGGGGVPAGRRRVPRRAGTHAAERGDVWSAGTRLCLSHLRLPLLRECRMLPPRGGRGGANPRGGTGVRAEVHVRAAARKAGASDEWPRQTVSGDEY